MDRIVAHACHTTKATQDGLICKEGNLLNGSEGEWRGAQAGIGYEQTRSRYDGRQCRASRTALKDTWVGRPA